MPTPATVCWQSFLPLTNTTLKQWYETHLIIWGFFLRFQSLPYHLIGSLVPNYQKAAFSASWGRWIRWLIPSYKPFYSVFFLLKVILLKILHFAVQNWESCRQFVLHANHSSGGSGSKQLSVFHRFKRVTNGFSVFSHEPQAEAFKVPSRKLTWNVQIWLEIKCCFRVSTSKGKIKWTHVHKTRSW